MEFSGAATFLFYYRGTARVLFVRSECFECPLFAGATLHRDGNVQEFDQLLFSDAPINRHAHIRYVSFL